MTWKYSSYRFLLMFITILWEAVVYSAINDVVSTVIVDKANKIIVKVKPIYFHDDISSYIR